nr:hypothetical protein Iba_chr02cCG11620 [Ipomoea batatas]
MLRLPRRATASPRSSTAVYEAAPPCCCYIAERSEDKGEDHRRERRSKAVEHEAATAVITLRRRDYTNAARCSLPLNAVHGVRHCSALSCEGEQRGRGDPSQSTAAIHRRPLPLPLHRFFLADEEEQRKMLRRLRRCCFADGGEGDAGKFLSSSKISLVAASRTSFEGPSGKERGQTFTAEACRRCRKDRR